MGGDKTEQPLFGEVAVRPDEAIAFVVGMTVTTQAATEQASQTHSQPSIQIAEAPRGLRVLEVRKPAAERPVHIRHDAGQRMP